MHTPYHMPASIAPNNASPLCRFVIVAVLENSVFPWGYATPKLAVLAQDADTVSYH